MKKPNPKPATPKTKLKNRHMLGLVQKRSKPVTLPALNAFKKD